MKKCVLVILSLSLLAACSRETSSDVYDSQNFGEATKTYPGVIEESHEVTVTNGEGLQDNTTGLLGGGVVGALLGSCIGKGDGKIVGAAVGGLAGATGGAAIEQGLKTEKAMQYIVKLDNGELRTVVQAAEPRLYPGQKVYLMEAHRGRSRVVARPHTEW